MSDASSDEYKTVEVEISDKHAHQRMELISENYEKVNNYLRDQGMHYVAGETVKICVSFFIVNAIGQL